MSEAVVTTSWNGMQVVTSPLTEMLLWVEDRMDNDKATFIQCMGAFELKTILQGAPMEIEANAAIINSAFLGNVISLSSDVSIKSIDIPHFTSTLMDMALDNRCKVAKVSKTGKIEVFSGQRGNFQRQEMMSETDNCDELQHHLTLSRCELVVSEWSANNATKVFKRLKKTRRGMVWLQLPELTEGTSNDVSVVFKRKLIEATLAYELLVIRSLLSSKSK